jgi:phosphocarrier protein HPr
MITQEVQIINKLGLHARAAAKLVSTANRFISRVELIKDNKRVNGKSILGVMMLAASQGTLLTIEVSGDDEEDAFLALQELILHCFGEAE